MGEDLGTAFERYVAELHEGEVKVNFARTTVFYYFDPGKLDGGASPVPPELVRLEATAHNVLDSVLGINAKDKWRKQLSGIVGNLSAIPTDGTYDVVCVPRRPPNGRASSSSAFGCSIQRSSSFRRLGLDEWG